MASTNESIRLAEESDMNVYAIAVVWIVLALIASAISIRAGVAVALAEILVGVLAGNLPFVSGLVQQTAFTTFLASVGSMVLTFLAGAEIDPVSVRRHWRASLAIGAVSFMPPFAAALPVADLALHWEIRAAEIAGVALSTTSVAVVYAVMVETGLNRDELGKLILAACFVTDLGTVLALGGVFADFGWALLAFGVGSARSLALLPFATRIGIRTLGDRVSEPANQL